MVRLYVGRVLGSLVGQTKRKLREAPAVVAGTVPYVQLIDEIDKAFDIRGGGRDFGVGRRVLGSLLTWLQVCPATVFSVFTANRTEGLPAELLRRGRLDEVFAVGLPCPAERAEVLAIHLRQRGLRPLSAGGMAEAVAASEGYVPAELKAAVDDAAVEALVTGREPDGALLAGCLRGHGPAQPVLRGPVRGHGGVGGSQRAIRLLSGR